MLNDPIANVMSAITTYEKIGKRELTIHPVSKLLQQTLTIMKDHGYVGALEEISPGRGGIAKLNLLGNVNKCGVIKPRFAVKTPDLQKFEKRYLPASGVGILILSTSKGLMTHEDARKNNIGGRLVAYCY